MPADSLLDMARRAMIRSANAIGDIGELPYEFVKPALSKLVSPKHLYELEQKSPQLIGHTGELWLNFIKRDVPRYQTKRHEPSDPKNWYKVYKKLMKEAEEENTKGEAELKAALDGIRAEKEKRTSHIVPQDQVGMIRGGRGPMVLSNGRWAPKSVKSMTLMEKIRKEARDAKTTKRNILPAQQLNRRTTVVREAPQQFVEQARRQAASPPPARQVVRTPRAPQPPMHAPSGPRGLVVDESYDIMKDRESRLKAMKIRTTNQPGSSHMNGASSSTGPSSGAGSEKTGGLSTAYLEDFSDDDDEPQKSGPSLKPPQKKQRSASPGRMNTQPVLKRKAQASSLFISPSKKPMLMRPGGK